MININFAVLGCSLMTLFISNPVWASVSSASSLSTPNTPLSVKTEPSFKIAAVHWLPDYFSTLNSRTNDKNSNQDKKIDCSDYNLVDTCGYGKEGTPVSPVPAISCFKGCHCTSSYQFDDSNCLSPYYPDGEDCSDSTGTRYNQCSLDVEEACKDFTQTCPADQTLSDDNRCQYDHSYGTCCNLCSAFAYTSIPDGYIEYEKCESCSGTQYKIIPNPCEGFTTCQYGAVSGAETCKSGTIIKYSSCKKCLFECTLSRCPTENGVVCRREECTGKYCISGCTAGYIDFDSYWCNSALKCWWPK